MELDIYTYIDSFYLSAALCAYSRILKAMLCVTIDEFHTAL